MGIIVPESKSLNNGVVLSEYYIGLRKNIDNKVNINVEFDPSAEITAGSSNVYKLTSYFEHHINRDAKARGKSNLDNQLVTIDTNDLGTSETGIVSQLYNELKKQYTDFTEDI
jgi:hypothetical protein